MNWIRKGRTNRGEVADVCDVIANGDEVGIELGGHRRGCVRGSDDLGSHRGHLSNEMRIIR